MALGRRAGATGRGDRPGRTTRCRSDRGAPGPGRRGWGRRVGGRGVGAAGLASGGGTGGARPGQALGLGAPGQALGLGAPGQALGLGAPGQALGLRARAGAGAEGPGRRWGSGPGPGRGPVALHNRRLGVSPERGGWRSGAIDECWTSGSSMGEGRHPGGCRPSVIQLVRLWCLPGRSSLSDRPAGCVLRVDQTRRASARRARALALSARRPARSACFCAFSIW